MVFVSFVIGVDGSVRNVGILKGIGGGCGEEAMRVIASMPNWKPGLQFGKPVAVGFRMPVVFKLEPAVKEKKRKKRHKGTP
ncbi:MAG: energy transducer TonB [Sphingobacteriales bacterium]|nr:energy transducer TonB [Sphingobacteriales bacterium]